jgi:hypothetical protein
MANKFPGILEKLKRTNENILNLQSEIGAFFQSSDYPIIPEDNKKVLLEAIEYHKNRAIPPRFSVLAGEIVHHLRSCFDHLVWELSEDTYRRGPSFWNIEFPVCEARPVDKKSVSRYERKIEGVTDIRARRLIEKLQPYNSPDPVDCPLLILHKMDIIDKHRELVLHMPTGAREVHMVPVEMAADFLMGKQSRISSKDAAALAHKLKGYGNLVPQIAFKEFGRREVQPVVPGLMQLNNYFVNVMNQFDP